jgi:hypothetical protein
MTSDGIACDYIDCDHPRATSWGWITASNGIDELSFCSQEHHDIWIEKNAGNFWDLKGLGSDDVRYGPRKTPKEDTGRVEYKCKLSPHITDENKQAIIQSLMTQFQGYNLNPTIVAPQDSYAFTISLDKGEMATSEIKDKLLWNYFIDNVSTRSDAKVVRNLHVDFLDKESSMVDGEPYDSTVDSNLHADTDGHNPQYIIDQDDIDGPQRSASVKVSNDELPLPDHVEDENKHQSIANYLKWKYNWNEMNRFGKPISDYSSSDVNKNLSILHGFTTDAWGDKCTCPLCSFARSVPSGSCSSCDKTYDQNLGDRIYVLRPGTNNIKKDVWTYNPETNDHRCPDCVGSIKTASLFIEPTHDETLEAHNKGIDLPDYADAIKSGATHKEILEAHNKGILLYHYNNARNNGITHNEILDSHEKDIDLYNYTSARTNGATHNETLEANNKNMDLNSYGYARKHGATHNEILEAHNKRIDLDEYGIARNNSATHDETLDAHDKGANLYGYGFARKYGATHKEALEAHNKGANLNNYGHARYIGYNHEQAMREQIPNYNPYDNIFGKSSSKISSVKPTDAEKQDIHNKNIDVDDYAYARRCGATHDEALEAHEKGVNLYNYAYAREYGATHNEILEARNKVANLNDYFYARDSGATHKEALEAHNKGANLNDYAYARNSGATHKEALEAHNKNIELSHYGLARDAGATHNEILNADKKGVNLNDYGHAIYYDATHNEALEAHDKNVDLGGYADARAYGATHNEILEAHNKGANLYDYAYARISSANHKEILEAHEKGVNLFSYGIARHSGATHNEILEAHNKNIDVYDYAYSRSYGAAHKEILEAHEKGVNLNNYGIARNNGNYTHDQAIREQIPNYNPYDDIFNKSSSIHEAIPYHVSPDYNRESIEEHGLQPNRPHHDWDWEKQWDPGMNVFLSPTADDASAWARQIQSTWRDEEDSDDSGREYPHDFDLYHVNTEGLSGVRPGMTDLGKEELVSKAPISPDRITHIETFDPWYEERIDQNTHTKESSMGIICDKCGKSVSLDEWQQSDNWTGKVFTGEGPHYCPSCSNNKKIDGNV